MPVKKTETIVEMKNLDECITICKDMTADNQYKLERAKSPANKRAAKTNISFWGSLSYYLGLVEAMTDDEIFEMKARRNVKNKRVENGS
ncbi:MAG TPA: hypothetical protein VIN11_07885 [Roseivirga sp.]